MIVCYQILSARLTPGARPNVGTGMSSCFDMRQHKPLHRAIYAQVPHLVAKRRPNLPAAIPKDM